MRDDSALMLRSGGRCECCGGQAGWSGWSRHHRQPRGMGGTKRDVHGLDNLLLICGSGTTGCHGHIERNREWAYETGFLVRRPFEPEHTALLYRAAGQFRPRWVLLSPTGGIHDLVDSPPLVPPPWKDAP